MKELHEIMFALKVLQTEKKIQGTKLQNSSLLDCKFQTFDMKRQTMTMFFFIVLYARGEICKHSL